MRTMLMRCVTVAGLMLSACAAEVDTRPTLAYETEPGLVEVEPGVQVVGDADDEVFVSGGSYWTRRGERWYSAPDYRGHWAVAESHAVPERIRTYPAGRYRRYHR